MKKILIMGAMLVSSPGVYAIHGDRLNQMTVDGMAMEDCERRLLCASLQMRWGPNHTLSRVPLCRGYVDESLRGSRLPSSLRLGPSEQEAQEYREELESAQYFCRERGGYRASPKSVKYQKEVGKLFE